MTGRAGRKALVTFLLLVGGALLAGGSVGQMLNPKDDPRNDKYWEAIDAACMGHHVGEMSDAFRIVLLTNYARIPVGRPVEFAVEIRHANPNVFPLQIYDLGATLDLGNATNVVFVTESKEPFTKSEDFQATNQDAGRRKLTEFQVEENVTEIRVVLDGQAGTLDQVPVGGADLWELRVFPFANQQFFKRGQGSSTDKTVKFSDPLDIYSRGLGTWIAEATYRGQGPEAAATLGVEVFYNTTDQRKMTVTGLDEEGRPAVIRDVERARIAWTIMATEEGPAVLDFTFFARDHFDHPQGLAAQDDGRFLRFYVHQLDVGAEGSGVEYRTSARQFAQPPVSVNVYNLVGRITGFIAAIVVPLAMVTGGVLGKGSRKSVNVLTGGAKKRVLWHAAMSFIIIGIVAVHLVLMLLEPTFAWEKGFLWGMAGLVFMATLGVSGYYQVRIIKRWNYRTWRFMHLSAGVFVFLTMLMHTVVDGSDFQFLRDDFPSLNRFIWP